MSPEVIKGLVAVLSKYHPVWIAIILAVSILCYRVPDIIHALR
jgi:hypothetical protein